VRIWGTVAGAQCLRLSERFFIIHAYVIGVDIVLTLDVCNMFVCLYVSALERKRLIGMT